MKFKSFSADVCIYAITLTVFYIIFFTLNSIKPNLDLFIFTPVYIGYLIYTNRGLLSAKSFRTIFCTYSKTFIDLYFITALLGQYDNNLGLFMGYSMNAIRSIIGFFIFYLGFIPSSVYTIRKLLSFGTCPTTGYAYLISLLVLMFIVLIINEILPILGLFIGISGFIGLSIYTIRRLLKMR